jgi:hypothetical protein
MYVCRLIPWLPSVVAVKDEKSLEADILALAAK